MNRNDSRYGLHNPDPRGRLGFAHYGSGRQRPQKFSLIGELRRFQNTGRALTNT